jgi:thiol-disulfide isomerase/thioredoxin
MSRLLSLAFLYILVLEGCFVMENKFIGLPPGSWRAVLYLNPETHSDSEKDIPPFTIPKYELEDVVQSELPFNFEVIYENDTTFYIEIINGEERIKVESSDINFGRNKARARDTIRINFPVYDSYFVGSFAGNTIEGSWIVLNRENYSIPFVATQGKNYRFTSTKKPPAYDLTGNWQVTFGIDKEKQEPAIGEFKQTGNRLTGTFLTEIGDYRYLEGTVLGDHAWLSCFDGAHAFLFEMKIQNDGKLLGAFYSGKHEKSLWEATRQENARLTNPDSLTYLKPGHKSLDFAFENPDGKVVSPKNQEYQGKVKIIQIMGTWCPNCWDETKFLVDYLKNNPSEDLAVIALDFEKHTDKNRVNKAIKTYKKRFGINYEVVHAGSSDKDKASQSLPMLNQVISFPTLIFLGKNNEVVRIHTGFYGPATSKYEEFTKEFDSFVGNLLSSNTN